MGFPEKATNDLNRIRKLVIDDFDSKRSQAAGHMCVLGAEASPQSLARDANITVDRAEEYLADDSFWKLVGDHARILGYSPTRVMAMNRLAHSYIHENVIRALRSGAIDVDRQPKVGRDLVAMSHEEIDLELKIKSLAGATDTRDKSRSDMEQALTISPAARFYVRKKAEAGNELAQRVLESGQATPEEMEQLLGPVINGEVVDESDGDVEEFERAEGEN